MKRVLFLALTCAMSASGSAAGPSAQGQQGQKPGVATGAVVDAKGVISGTVRSSDRRPLSDITVQLVDARGLPVVKTVTSKNGGYTLSPVSYDMYTLQCIQKDKVLEMQSVTLRAPMESVDLTCTSDVIAWWKKPPVLAGLAAAAAAISATAIVSSGNDASGSR